MRTLLLLVSAICCLIGCAPPAKNSGKFDYEVFERVNRLLLEARSEMQRGGALSEAERVLLLCYDLAPEDYRVLDGLGYVSMLRGAEDDAAFWFNRALAEKPDYGPALHHMGLAALLDGNLPAAETLLRRSISADPTNFLARESLARLLYRTGSDKAALVELYRADKLAANPGRAELMMRPFP